MVRYDSGIIIQFAHDLYNQAKFTVVMFTVGGIVIGAGGGLLLSTQAALIGATVLGAIGYVYGRATAFRLKLEAQLALCQLQIELNTRSRESVERVQLQPSSSDAAPQLPPNRPPTLAAPSLDNKRDDVVSENVDFSKVVLSPLEQKCLRLMAQGPIYTSDLADALDISGAEVAKLQTGLKTKFSITSNEQLVTIAKRYAAEIDSQSP